MISESESYVHWQCGPQASGFAPQPASVSSDTLYLLRRLLSNQHTLTGPEFRAELEKIVGEAYQQEAQEPVWDGKLSDAMRNALDALYLQCGHEIARDISHQVRKECEAIYTSYTTAKRMYQTARDRLEAIETAQPQPDPFAAPQPATAPLSGGEQDAARYRYLRDVPMSEWPDKLATAFRLQQNTIWDATIDAALAAQGENT